MGNDGLGLVVDVVDGAESRVAVDELEGSEHADGTHIHVVYLVVVKSPLEVKFGLADCLQIKIDNEVVVDYSIEILSLGFGLVRNAYGKQLTFSCLPNRSNSAFYSSEVVLLSYGVFYLVVMV